MNVPSSRLKTSQSPQHEQSILTVFDFPAHLDQECGSSRPCSPTLFVAAAIAVATPDADVNDLEARAPEFANLDTAIAGLISLVAESLRTHYLTPAF